MSRWRRRNYLASLAADYCPPVDPDSRTTCVKCGREKQDHDFGVDCPVLIGGKFEARKPPAKEGV